MVTAQRTVPVEELEVALQDGPDLHLPLCGAAGVQEVDHRGQALQGQSWEPRVFGFRGGLTTPRTQDCEQVLNRLRSDGLKAILLKKIKAHDQPVTSFPSLALISECRLITDDEKN